MLKIIGFFVIAACLLSSAAASAEENKDIGVIVIDEITKKECGACHLPFGPINLPARSWQKIMANLEKHFGENAGLDEPTRKHVEDYMVGKSMDSGLTNYGKITSKKLGDKTYIRISGTPSWARHHDERHVTPEEWKKVKSKSDCRACHRPGIGG
ncbi:MAG: hypothetical protein A3G18_07365 [Rhodospirillales bacterium RIFCSPLOWO2_12_FULL_58_28]|nr:MAG: hypothetical protein A3H92_08835 [Rhodospirillales bacterium RIFCSPLOWO2_02_FULL_58_16]OHC77545.1 MAG: hypothetical protein A3G18_07365 [Rhodospirillales bacterium RIFCSPLOWO2_12_FULL_58_28]